ncbi:MAG TPA: hypothetical protein DCZ10_03570 [Pelotomaculum sp.]|nr:hypothetical protein [Pelotomaculum sp.]
MVIEEFRLPFQGKLDANNRWVKLAKMIPWESIKGEKQNGYASRRRISSGQIFSTSILDVYYFTNISLVSS